VILTLAFVSANIFAETLHFKNCKEARSKGYKNIKKGEPGYARHLDRDNDGIACERK
jgi:putative pneumococcal surface protein